MSENAHPPSAAAVLAHPLFRREGRQQAGSGRYLPGRDRDNDKDPGPPRGSSISYTAEMLSADLIGMRQRASNWGLVGLIAGGILLSPIFGFLMALVVDILIGLLNDGGVPALLTLVVASAIGGFLFRAMLPRPWGSASVGTCAGRCGVLPRWFTSRLGHHLAGAAASEIAASRSPTDACRV
jgi:hypothetical protein